MFDPDVVEAALDHIEDSPHASPLATASTPALAPISSADLPLPTSPAQACLEALNDISRATRYPIAFEECCTLVAARLQSIVPHRTFVVRDLRNDDELVTRFACGESADAIRDLELPIVDRVSGAAVKHRCTIAGQDHGAPIDEPGLRSDFEERLDDPHVRRLSSTLAAPLVLDGRCVGVLSLYDDDDRRFTSEDRRNLAGVAAYLARSTAADPRETGVALRLTDPLTGLPDAQFLWIEAARHFDAVESRGRDGIIGFRVRRLAEVAERHGATIAEDGLRRIAERLSAACRDSETLVRLGPDLFVVLCQGESAGDLVERWSELLDAVEAEPLDVPAEVQLPLRLTAAQARYPEDGHDLDALLSVLDVRLSAAIDAGRTVVPFRGRGMRTA